MEYMKKTPIEIIKNNKTYHYYIPEHNREYYEKIVNFLSDLGTDRTRIIGRYCTVFSKKKILTKLKKFFGTNKVEYYGINKFDKYHEYFIIIMNDDEWKKYRTNIVWDEIDKLHLTKNENR